MDVNDKSRFIGDDLDRVEGRAKVTGAAHYAAEYDIPDVHYGVLVNSAIAKGKILSLNTKEAEAAPGVIAVISHLNRPEVSGWETRGGQQGESRLEGQEFRVFYDDTIHFDRQPIALVIANTFERATYAASLVKARYQKEAAKTDMAENLSNAVQATRAKDYSRGNNAALQAAPVKIEARYTTPFQVHNPMETHAATVVWEAPDKVTVYNKTQATKIAQQDIMKTFGLKEENVVVHSPFVGGAFGSSSRVWPEEMAALLGAKKTGKPVKVMLRREEAFNMVGYRPTSVQKISIGAQHDGTLVGIVHEAIGSTSQYEQFTERMTDPTKVLYNCPNVTATYRLVPLDMSTPCWTRGPGETSGSFALESAMDELAYALNMDPLALRLKNFSEKDLEKDKPWSSNYLQDCYRLGAEKFGWEKRNPAPRSTQRNGWLVGAGMAAGIYHANRSPATVAATLQADGTLVVQTSVADTGPGSATIMTQIAADAMGMDVRKVKFQWGHSTLPPAPGQFGSQTTASTGSGVHDAVKALQKRLAAMLLNKPESSFAGETDGALVFENEFIQVKENNTRLSYSEALKSLSLTELRVVNESKPTAEKEAYSGYSFAAHFVEVLVHPSTGEVRLNRVVSAVDSGKVMNKKTATSQVYGSVVWGTGIALMEEGILDHRYGRYVNNDLANYHVPVNADVPLDVTVLFTDKPDPVLDPMGAKGLGEIGLVGFTAAVANAVYHATGKRIRDLPITPDKIIG
jgi:xanthine dehydrogenase YagR molybdenum-binding subunit